MTDGNAVETSTDQPVKASKEKVGAFHGVWGIPIGLAGFIAPVVYFIFMGVETMKIVKNPALALFLSSWVVVVTFITLISRRLGLSADWKFSLEWAAFTASVVTCVAGWYQY